MSKYTKRSSARRRRLEQNRLIVWGILSLIGIFLLAWLIKLIEAYILYIGLAIAVTLAFWIYLKIARFLKRRKLQGELHEHLIAALKAMDSTFKTYTDEEAANRELVATLPKNSKAKPGSYCLLLRASLVSVKTITKHLIKLNKNCYLIMF